MYTFFIILVVLYSVAFFLDVLFKTCMFFPYFKLLHDTGMSIRPFSIYFETTRFNRMFLKLGRWKPTFVQKWFQTGLYLTTVCMIPSFVLLAIPLIQYLLRPATYATVTPLLVPAVPGMSLPFSHIYYYIVVIFISVIFHEFGHGLSASRERIAIEGCGFAVFAFLPVAYVKLPTENLKQLSLQQQMRIFSAGIWHNFILAILGIFVVYSSAFFLLPVFQTGKGITVIDLTEDSGAAQPGGLVLEDNIVGINDCIIYTRDDWKNCLEKIATKPQPGFCVSESFIALENTAVANGTSSQCCPNISQHLCFQRTYASKVSSLLCLPGRKVIDSSEQCVKDEDCGIEPCVHPVFDSLTGRFLKIYKHHKAPTLYLGSVHELYLTVTVTRWVSKYKSLPASFADMFDTFFIYLIACSSGLAIMNVLPCYFLDGQYLTECFVHYFLPSVLCFKKRVFLISVLNVMGLLLLIFTFFLAVH